MSNNSYVTVLSTANYLEGTLALAESLKQTKTNYPLTVLITDEISRQVEEELKRFGINVIRKNKVEIPEVIKQKNNRGNFSHWSNTFDKLLLFELVEFDKLVYLDSDMFVRKNIDELFEKENMSATVDRSCGPVIDLNNLKLTSGTLVIKPTIGMLDKFMHILSEIADKRDSVGDQDILQEYDLDWHSKKELHIDLKYNMFFPHTDYYTHFGDYSLDDICVTHFIYTKKPFHLKRSQTPEYMDYIANFKNKNYENYKLDALKKCILCGSEDEEKILSEYFDILELVRSKIQEKER